MNMTLDEREEIIRRVRAALYAIEHGDQATFQGHLDALVGWRNQPLVQGLIRLARELGQAFGVDPAASSTSSLPEACARLEHAVKMGEDASHRTMDLIDECRGLLATIPAGAGTPAADAVAAIRARFSEITAAQGFQDLTGQIIHRVIDIVRTVHSLDGDTAEARPLQLPEASSRGYGPSVTGVDATPATQDNADELLSALGL